MQQPPPSQQPFGRPAAPGPASSGTSNPVYPQPQQSPFAQTPPAPAPSAPAVFTPHPSQKDSQAVRISAAYPAPTLPQTPPLPPKPSQQPTPTPTKIMPAGAVAPTVVTPGLDWSAAPPAAPAPPRFAAVPPPGTVPQPPSMPTTPPKSGQPLKPWDVEARAASGMTIVPLPPSMQTPWGEDQTPEEAPKKKWWRGGPKKPKDQN